jgi:hypothetical protein
VVEVADAVLAHQPGGLLGHPQPVALLAIVRMDAMVLAACHGRRSLEGRIDSEADPA